MAILAALGLIVYILVVPAVATILNGWALTKLWAWFIVPTFGAPALSIALACGIALLASVLTHQDDSDHAKKEDDSSTGEKLFTAAVMAALRPLVYVGIGWLILQFM